MGRLEGRVALITGGAGGQGSAEARLFVAHGASVLVADIDDEGGQALAGELGSRASYLHLDVAQEEDWAAAVAAASAEFGRLDTVIHNAAVFRPRSLDETTTEHWDSVVGVNQRGTFFGLKAVVPALEKAGGGAIVCISSGAGVRGTTGMFAYGTTKWAIRGMARNAAIELAPRGIRVNTILPGVIDTPMLKENPADSTEAFMAMIPLDRIGSPEDIAKAALFLASDDAAYITGVDLPVDGGFLA